MKWTFKRFTELSTLEYFAIIKFRTAIFVVEQQCPYQEVDDNDLAAIHLFCSSDDGEVVAVARIIQPKENSAFLSFGRVAVKKEYRGTKVSKALMEKLLDYILSHFPNKTIEISAQCYITSYYERYGFKQQGEMYLEDDIPHIRMVREAT